MQCLSSAKYSFKADVHKRIPEQTRSGQIKYNWSETPDKSVVCFAEAVLSDGIRVTGTTERFGKLYENVDYVYITTAKPLSRADRVTNIRSAKTGVPVWVEDELEDAPPTVFNVNGSMPITDGFGRVVEYKTLLQRAEVQKLGS